MNDGFNFIYGPLVENNLLDKTKPYREVCIHCICEGNYRIYVNGEDVIPPIPENVFCPFCYRPATDFWMVSGHSGGYFNASYFRSVSTS